MRLREAAVCEAAKFIGTVESPANSNRGRMIDRWNLDACGVVGVYWCASFVHGIFKRLGFNLPGGASVGQILAWGRAHGYVVTRPRRGDLVCFEFNHNALYDDHIGFVERVLAIRWSGKTFTGWVQTIEGNTSSGNAGSQDNGGGVFRRRRWVRGIAATFVRVPGDA